MGIDIDRELITRAQRKTGKISAPDLSTLVTSTAPRADTASSLPSTTSEQTKAEARDAKLQSHMQTLTLSETKSAKAVSTVNGATSEQSALSAGINGSGRKVSFDFRSGDIMDDTVYRSLTAAAGTQSPFVLPR